MVFVQKKNNDKKSKGNPTFYPNFLSMEPQTNIYIFGVISVSNGPWKPWKESSEPWILCLSRNLDPK